MFRTPSWTFFDNSGFSGGGCAVLCHPVRVKLLGCLHHVGRWSIWVICCLPAHSSRCLDNPGALASANPPCQCFLSEITHFWIDSVPETEKKAEIGSNSGQEADSDRPIHCSRLDIGLTTDIFKIQALDCQASLSHHCLADTPAFTQSLTLITVSR